MCALTPLQVRTFTELISACCKAGALDAAFGLLYQMCSEGVEPSRVTYDIMLRASCASNAPGRFYELKGMITRGVRAPIVPPLRAPPHRPS